jgi:hypothetical protein
VKLMNFNQDLSAPLSLSFRNFARNETGDQAFISSTKNAGSNWPINVRSGPDGCASVVDYGAVRDPGGDTGFCQSGRCSAGSDPGHRRDLQDPPVRRR